MKALSTFRGLNPMGTCLPIPGHETGGTITFVGAVGRGAVARGAQVASVDRGANPVGPAKRR